MQVILSASLGDFGDNNWIFSSFKPILPLLYQSEQVLPNKTLKTSKKSKNKQLTLSGLSA